MEASTRFLLSSSSISRHLLLRNPNPRFLPLPPLNLPSRRRPAATSAAGATSFLSSSSPFKPYKPFASLSSPLRSLLNQKHHHDLDSTNGSPVPALPVTAAEGGDLGFVVGGNAAANWTVVILGWLGAEEKHLKRYAEMYGAKGFRSVRFVVPVKETVGFDLGRNVDERIEGLAREVARWCEEGERDGKERNLVFHTFSNAGWLV